MTREVINLPTVQNVAANSTFTIHCPVGKTYERIMLVRGGTTFTEAQLTNIRVEVNGKTIASWKDAAELDAENSFYGRNDTANYHTLHFSRAELDSITQDRVTGLGTADVQTLTVRGDITGATAPTLKAKAVLRGPEPMGLVTKVKQFSYSSSGSAFEIADLPRGPRLMALHVVDGSSGVVSGVKLIADGSERLVFDNAAEMNKYNQDNGRASVSGRFVLDFCGDGDLYESLVTDRAVIQDLRVQITMSTPGDFLVVAEFLDGYAGI